MVHAHQLEFKIDQLRKDKMIMALNSIAVMIMAFFVTVFLPQLLFQFLFSSQELTAEPPVIKYIPVAAFVVAVLHFAYAIFMVITKTLKVKQLYKELEMLSVEEDCCGNCGCDHENDEHHSNWLNENADEMSMDIAPMTKSSAKSATKTPKKTAAKKKTAKK